MHKIWYVYDGKEDTLLLNRNLCREILGNGTSVASNLSLSPEKMVLKHHILWKSNPHPCHWHPCRCSCRMSSWRSHGWCESFESMPHCFVHCSLL